MKPYLVPIWGLECMAGGTVLDCRYHTIQYYTARMGSFTLFESIWGCSQNYGPFLGPLYSTAPSIQGTLKGTIILKSTHI